MFFFLLEKKNKLNAISANNEITSNTAIGQKIVEDNEQITARRKINKQNSDLSPTKINASNSKCKLKIKNVIN